MRVVLEQSGEGHHKKYRWKAAEHFILQCQGPQCFLCAGDRFIPVFSEAEEGVLEATDESVWLCCICGLCYFTAASPFWGASEMLPFAVMDGSGLWLSCHLFLFYAQPWSSWASQTPLFPFWYGKTHHTYPGISLGYVIQENHSFCCLSPCQDWVLISEILTTHCYKVCAVGTRI